MKQSFKVSVTKCLSFVEVSVLWIIVYVFVFMGTILFSPFIAFAITSARINKAVRETKEKGGNYRETSF